jgi:hypothetical protein
MAATINWSTAADLLAADGDGRATVEDPSDPVVTETLLAAFPEMQQALDPDALALADFEGFGPVQHFRDLFIAGWHSVLEMIRAERRDAGG